MKTSRTDQLETPENGRCYEFGTFRLDPGRRRLETTDGRLLRTSAKAFDALQYFLEHPAQPIARRTLLEALWPDAVVEENNLSQAVSGLRKVLGDGYIVTVPGRGYQFVAGVRRPGADAARAHEQEKGREAEPVGRGWRARAGVALAFALTIAVSGWIYFAETGSAGIPAAMVGNPASGDSQTGSPDAVAADEFDAYGVPGGTENERANEYYRLGKLAGLRRDRDGLLQAAGEFERARALDENFALAQIALAQTLYRIATASTEAADSADYMDQFIRARDEVLETWPGVQAARGLAAQRYISEGQWRHAETLLAEWVKLTAEEDFDALMSYGAFLGEVGRAQDALHYLEAAHHLKPNLAQPSIVLAMEYDSLGQPDRAQELDDNALSLAGYMTMFAAPQFWRRLAAGDDRGAQQLFIDVAVAVSGWDRHQVEGIVRMHELPQGLNAFSQLMATSVLNLDDSGGGLEYLRDAYGDPELRSGAGMLNVALFAAHFGDMNLSIKALRRSLEFDRVSPLTFSWLPLMRPVRRHEEFKALLRELGIVEYWRESGWPDHCRPLRDDDFACS